MTNLKTPDLAGRSFLVVEDAYFLAMEIKDEVVRAGGTVLGPCGDAIDGLAELQRCVPDGAVVDINLGAGPSFEMADALRSAGVPFIFLTGYDAAVVPERFSDVEQMEKPANVALLVAKLHGYTSQRGGTSSPR